MCAAPLRQVFGRSVSCEADTEHPSGLRLRLRGELSGTTLPGGAGSRESAQGVPGPGGISQGLAGFQEMTEARRDSWGKAGARAVPVQRSVPQPG